MLILVQRQTGTFWGLPKGHVDNGETLAEAALRETAEETGLGREDLRVACYLGHIYYEFVTHEEKKTLNEKEVHFFLVTAPHAAQATAPKFAEEGILEVRWFPMEEALMAVSYDNYRRIIKLAESALSK